ncbi:MAG: chemotaxis protein CheX [Oligoflexales bacterium]
MAHAEKTDSDSLLERYEDVVSAFKKATLHIFSKQFSIDLKCGDIYEKNQEDPDKNKHFALTAKINLTSKKCEGAVVVLFTEDVFIKLLSQALGEDFGEIDEELKDGACEILNMIFGSARTELNIDGDHYAVMDIPVIIDQKEIAESSLTPLPALMVPFISDFGEFIIQIGFKEEDRFILIP